MVDLTSSDSIVISLAAAVATTQADWTASTTDVETTNFGLAALTPSNGQSNSTTEVTAVAAPSAGRVRKVTGFQLKNRDTANVRVTVAHANGATRRHLLTADVPVGEALAYTAVEGWYALDAGGRRKLAEPVLATPYAYAVPVYKVGTASEAVAQYYSHAKDTGFPGAWAPGTPGLNGRATDGTAAGDAGCLPIPNPSTGYNYLVGYEVSSTVVQGHFLHDILWVNSGLVVTTTTNQAITSVAWPARDIDGSANGRGLMVGILVATATTNAGAITNTTLSYTNELGTAGRTATMASFPATAVVGTIVWFQLQAGDMGIRSIQGITLGTSYAGGAISLIVARCLAQPITTVVNVSGTTPSLRRQELGGSGVRLFNGSCVLPFYLSTATTATNTRGTAMIEVR